MKKKTISIPDPDRERGIDLVLIDDRDIIDKKIAGTPQWNLGVVLFGPIVCIEIPFVDFENYKPAQFRHHPLLQSLEDLMTEEDRFFEEIRIWISFFRSYRMNKPLDLSKARIVRYSYHEAIDKQIIGGFEVV